MFLKFLWSKITLFYYLLFALSALFGIITFYQQRVDTLSQINTESQQVLKLINEGEFALRGQIQEFKDILLRGHNSEDKAHYYEAFLKKSQNFKEKIKQVIYLTYSLYPQESHLHAQLIQIQKTHDNLNESYLRAYALLGDGSYEKKMLADRQVRGADRNLPPLFDALRTSLKKSDAALHLKNNQILKDYTLAIVVMLLFILATSLYIYYTTRKISESKNMLDNILDHIAQGVMLIQDDKVAYASKKQIEIFGRDILGKSLEELSSFVHMQDIKKIIKEHMHMHKEKKTFLSYRYRLVLPDGSKKWVEDDIAVMYNSQGKFYRSYVISRDISDDIARKLQLEESEERYRTFVELSSDMLFLKDDAFRYLIINKNLARFFAKEESEIIGKTDYDLMAHENAKLCRMSDAHALIQGGKTVSEEQVGDRIYETTKYPMQFLKKTYLAGIIKDITEQKQAKDEIFELAFYNTVTDLPNKQFFQDRLKHSISISKQIGTKGAVVLMDVDHFKIINDTWGHNKGDLLLKTMAQRLANALHLDEMIAHMGGDEFVLLFENLQQNDAQNAIYIESRANEIKGQLQEPYFFEDKEYLCTLSMGAAFFCSKECNALSIIKNSEIALYQAKDDGRNRLRFFEEEMEQGITRRFELENALRKALEKNEFELYLQTQVDAQQTVQGAEALLRWKHNGMLVGPIEFIPILESSGLIEEVGLWVLEEGCKILQEWSLDARMAAYTLSVNVSVLQFEKENFIGHVERLLVQYALNPARLKLELTENLFLKNSKESIKKLSTLKALGVGIALDDFGTGYASLSYLKRIPISQLKIDQSFVRDIFDDTGDATIVELIISVGKKLGVEVLAEGVETSEQYKWLQDAGCDYFQGYLFDKPQPRALFEKAYNSLA